MPTWASSDDIRRWDATLRTQALFSARTTRKTYLASLRSALAKVASGELGSFQAKDALRRSLSSLGYTAAAGFPQDAGKTGPNGETIPPATRGSIRDLASSGRIGLILDTNVKQARSLAQKASGDNPVFLLSNPAWRLTRTGARKKPRGDWKRRWKSAGDACAWKGAVRDEFVAAKDSPIWAEIGKGAGGFGDALGNDYPPFAFGSGMAWVNVGRGEWRRICAKAGIPDGLDELTRRVAAKAGWKDGAKKPQSDEARRVERHRAKKVREALDKVLVARGLAPLAPAFSFDPRARDAALAAVEEMLAAKSEAERLAAEAVAARAAAEADAPGIVAPCAVAEVGGDFPKILAELSASTEAVEKSLAAMRVAFAGGGGSYAASVRERPLPTDAEGQRAYDLAVGIVARSAKKVAAKCAACAEEARKAAAAIPTFAVRLAEAFEAWKKAECDRIIAEADRILADAGVALAERDDAVWTEWKRKVDAAKRRARKAASAAA